MTAESYAAWTRWWCAHPKATSVMVAVNKALKYLGYLVYPLLLVLVFIFTPDLLFSMFAVPLVGFAVVTVMRSCVNEQRPYEKLDIVPLIRKDTKGKSFPSRHLFSMVMIAMCWLRWCLPVGVLLLVLCVIMGYIRVIGGVHFPHDVIAGALIAVLFGIVGLWVLPI